MMLGMRRSAPPRTSMEWGENILGCSAGPPVEHVTNRSPLREPVPAESPSTVSRRHCDTDAPSPSDMDHQSRRQDLFTPQPVSSHPITAIDDSSPSQTDDARGPAPPLHSGTDVQRTQNLHNQLLANKVRDSVSEPACPQDRPAVRNASHHSIPDATPSTVFRSKPQLSEAFAGAVAEQESRPAKARRRTPPELSSRSLVSPPPELHATVSMPRNDHSCEYSGSSGTCDVEGSSGKPPEMSQVPVAHAASAVPQSVLPWEGREGACVSRAAEPWADGDPMSGTGAEDRSCGVIVPEDSRGSSVSEKEELLQFLGNLSQKYDLNVDVKAISPTVRCTTFCALPLGPVSCCLRHCPNAIIMQYIFLGLITVGCTAGHRSMVGHTSGMLLSMRALVAGLSRACDTG